MSTTAEGTQHPLKVPYSLWVAPRTSARSALSYQSQLVQLASFATVEGFWRHYAWTIPPSQLSFNCDLSLFREAVRPIWEDEHNQEGGKWEVHLKKGVASRCFEDVALAVLGDQFRVGDEICGVVVSVKTHEDLLSVWNRSAHDNDVILSIRDTLKQVLNIPTSQVFQYQPHGSKMVVAMRQQQHSS